MSERRAQHVTDAELAVLRTLWDRGAATIRETMETLYPGGGTSAYSTVQKLLERLESKGYVVRERRPDAHLFRAAVGRDALIARRLQDVADSLCDGSWAPLLTNLVESRRLSAEDRQAMRDLVRQLDRDRQDDECDRQGRQRGDR